MNGSKDNVVSFGKKDKILKDKKTDGNVYEKRRLTKNRYKRYSW